MYVPIYILVYISNAFVGHYIQTHFGDMTSDKHIWHKYTQLYIYIHMHTYLSLYIYIYTHNHTCTRNDIIDGDTWVSSEGLTGNGPSDWVKFSCRPNLNTLLQDSSD